ncbi:peptidoglycan-binding domain-containing protein [Dongia rigui]|uniref:Peptidoglycan-binding domain-containing protein n=1 Tax=Dongia rigui TaxID=940149 RepID=A0ABU5DUP0_9PROT|nr:peptidoglycan-binding domain-containing protein [Dongia rigui]MDY0871007.1 peptidoglycan-binding domain-containing protein [Dongia rigui]
MDEVRSQRPGVKVSPADRFSSSMRREEDGARAEAKRLMVSFGVVAAVLAVAVGLTLYIWHDVGAPSDVSDAPSASAQVQQIEKLLADLGFAPGPQDGVMDEATAEAIRSYQQAAGLPEDGAATPALLEELKAVAGQ